MPVYITAKRMSITGSRYEHITHVQWKQGNKTGLDTRQEMVDWINKGNKVYIDGRPDVQVVVVNASPQYLRSVKDGTFTNNLLQLPNC